jgi:signal transduction histidine kinase
MYQRPEEYAKYWVEEAVRFYKAVGRDVALAEFSNTNGMFVQDELYVYVLSTTGTMLAHGVNPRFVGLDFSPVKDYDENYFIKKIVEKAKSEGSGWERYRWYHPRRNKILPKMAFFQKEDDLIFCSAVYEEEA